MVLVHKQVLIFGGEGPPTTGATELYNGTTWTEVKI
jgi:hypothetical protein